MRCLIIKERDEGNHFQDINKGRVPEQITPGGRDALRSAEVKGGRGEGALEEEGAQGWRAGICVRIDEPISPIRSGNGEARREFRNYQLPPTKGIPFTS